MVSGIRKKGVENVSEEDVQMEDEEAKKEACIAKEDKQSTPAPVEDLKQEATVAASEHSLGEAALSSFTKVSFSSCIS